MVVFRAAGIEGGRTLGTGIARVEILSHRHSTPARPAQDGLLPELFARPYCWRMIRDLRVALEARIPTPATLEFDRNNIERRMPMRATGLGIDLDTVDFYTVNDKH